MRHLQIDIVCNERELGWCPPLAPDSGFAQV
jgi:hypothetical protein